MLSQPLVRTPGGDDVLLDKVLGPGFALVGLDCPAADLQAVVRTGLWHRLSVQAVSVASDASVADGHAVVLRDSRFVETLRQHRGDVLLVRPDRYIAAAVRPEELSRLEVELQRLMAGTGD